MSDSAWAVRWRTLLGGEDAARRIAEGRGYARSGRVTGVRLGTGVLSGRVQGRGATARAVEVRVAPLPAQAWEEIVATLAHELRHSARLLAGLEPECLEYELAERGVALLPEPDDVRPDCTCTEPQPCAHAAALWEAGATLVADDPFALLRFRGRGRERLLAAVAAARGGAGSREHQATSELDVHGWMRARTPLEDLRLPADDAHQPAALAVLGNPPGWPGGPDAVELFAPLVDAAAQWAARGGDPED